MYTEIVKIIEAGVSLDRGRVMSYAAVLAENLAKKGDCKFAERIRSILSRTRGTPVTLDSFGVKPVDGESRLDIVDVTLPTLSDDRLVLDQYVRDEVDDFVAGYAHRDELVRIGASIGNALLLYGPPGCGKTSIANLIAARAQLPLVTARFDTLVSSLLGSTSKNIRKVFDYAAQKPCVLFLDEFDVVAKMRDDKNELGELKRVVNGLLQEMDGFSPESILIAASNHHELLDRAVWRRFDKVLKLDMPSETAIGCLIDRYLSGYDNGFLSRHRDKEKVVLALAGCSHSGVRTCVMNALRSAVVSGRKTVSTRDVVKEAYLSRHHAFDDERAYVGFLLDCGFSIRVICNEFSMSERLVREVSLSRKEKKLV